MGVSNKIQFTYLDYLFFSDCHRISLFNHGSVGIMFSLCSSKKCLPFCV